MTTSMSRLQFTFYCALLFSWSWRRGGGEEGEQVSREEGRGEEGGRERDGEHRDKRDSR